MSVASFLAATFVAMGSGSVRAAGDDGPQIPPPSPPGEVLHIPGLPPITLPPGTRVFGPNGSSGDIGRRGARDGTDNAGVAPKKGAEEPKAAEKQPPKPDITQPEGRRKILDDLFGRLGSASDDREAQGIAGAIERVWMRSGSDTADLLMSRALQAMQTKDWTLSEALLDKVVAIDPDWAEAWNKRATARYSDDDDAGAMEDIAHTLAIEPRHFGALAGLGFILRRSKMDKQALRAFRKALEINPRQEEIRKLVDKLTLEVEGQAI